MKKKTPIGSIVCFVLLGLLMLVKAIMPEFSKEIFWIFFAVFSIGSIFGAIPR